MTPEEEGQLRAEHADAMRRLEDEAAAWLEARAAGRATIAAERRLSETERETRRLERRARRRGVTL